jgi:hypothetical protein
MAPSRFIARIRPSVSALERNLWKADSANATPAANSPSLVAAVAASNSASGRWRIAGSRVA